MNKTRISNNHKFPFNEGNIIKFDKDKIAFKYITNKLLNAGVTIWYKFINSLNETKFMKNDVNKYISFRKSIFVQSQL